MDQSNENRPRREHLSGHGTISGFALLDGLGVTFHLNRLMHLKWS
jgi:hypothetical protein